MQITLVTTVQTIKEENYSPNQEYNDTIIRVENGVVLIYIPDAYVTVAALDVLKMMTDELPVGSDGKIFEASKRTGYTGIYYRHAV